MALADDIARIAAVASSFAADGDELAAVIPAEPGAGSRVYLCAYGVENEDKRWLALDEGGRPIGDRRLVRDAVSIAVLCEVAEETAGGGKLDELRSQLVALRLTENPPGIDEAEEAALELERTIAAPPRVATPAYLDLVGGATRRLEQALGETGRSPFAEAMKAAMETADHVATQVEDGYIGELG